MSDRYFPQLSTGALMQFPSEKTTSQRTVINRAPGDALVKMADPESAYRKWDLRYSGLSDVEVGRLRDLFLECEGRLRSFAMIDPCANLLLWSEELTNDVWQTSMGVTGSVSDPYDGEGAFRLTNGAQASAAVSQSVDIPAWYRYTFSVWARSQSAASVKLRLASSDGQIAAEAAIGSDWQRLQVSGAIEGDSGSLRCEIFIPGGTAVDVFGPQLEAQSDASSYRETKSEKGVCIARFDQDEFACTSHGPDDHAVMVRVRTVRE